MNGNVNRWHWFVQLPKLATSTRALSGTRRSTLVAF
jgi:hypothetical protein